MASHESHERLCPHCKARISATAPKCLNCGEYVTEDGDDDHDDDVEESSSATRVLVFVIAWLSIVFLGIAVVVLVVNLLN